MLPDYLVEENGGLVQLFGESDTVALDAYFVYPEELKSVARVQVFRDFLVSQGAALALLNGERRSPRRSLRRPCRRVLHIGYRPSRSLI